jgi:hypothetical protein
LAVALVACPAKTDVDESAMLDDGDNDAQDIVLAAPVNLPTLSIYP